MTETSKYLSVLAKVMRNKYLPEEGYNRENYNNLYYLIHSELNSKLQKSVYPHTSDIIQKTEDMLEAIEPLCLCPEVVGKKCLWISSYITTDLFRVCEKLFLDHKFISELKRIYTQIPFIIVDTDRDDIVEVINYANIRISLTISELKYLFIESSRRKFALNKIIQFVIVSTKLINTSLCIISDNIYSYAEGKFSRILSGRLVYIDDKGIKMIEQRRIDIESSLLMNDDTYAKIENNTEIAKYNRIHFSEIADFIENEVKSVLYGFWEEYTSIETQILDYYDNQLMQSKRTMKEVVGDIVRIGDGCDNILRSIRSVEDGKEKKLKAERNDIAYTLRCIDELISRICSELGETLVTGKAIPKRIFDDVFASLFRCKDYNSELAKKLLAKLITYEYDNYDLVTAYVQANSGIGTHFEAIDIKPNEWEKAKMLIDILNLDEVPISKLETYINVLGERCSTGKELYVKALISSGNKHEILQKSMQKGYEKAGDMLIDMYKSGCKEINLQTLANALVPEACMILADQNMESNQNKRRFVDLSDRKFTYYKIAAACQYLPAIGKIVDVVYESRFSSGFQIPDDELSNSKYEEMIDNGHIICQLCNYLIGKEFKPDHYREILGVVYFSLNENLSGAMSFLSNPKSALAFFCKGKMYEFGHGVAVDLNLAIRNYELSLRINYSQRTEKRLLECQSKKTKKTQENDYYQATRSYHSSTTYSGTTNVDDSCFAPKTKILMSDGTYRCVEDIKLNDSVLVFNHYSGMICEEKIIANVHDNSNEAEVETIVLKFEERKNLMIVKSHALFDTSLNRYVWINVENVGNYVGDSFACVVDGIIVNKKMVGYNVERKKTKYYMPISRYHLNVFAEGILSIPPTKVTLNMFACKNDMLYDISVLSQYGITEYDDIKQIVSYEEYMNLPCKYLRAVCEANNLSIDDFVYAINLYREQKKYYEIDV